MTVGYAQPNPCSNDCEKPFRKSWPAVYINYITVMCSTRLMLLLFHAFIVSKPENVSTFRLVQEWSAATKFCTIYWDFKGNCIHCFSRQSFIERKTCGIYIACTRSECVDIPIAYMETD